MGKNPRICLLSRHQREVPHAIAPLPLCPQRATQNGQRRTYNRPLKRKSARRPFQDAQHSGHIPLCVAFQLRLAGCGVEGLVIPGALPISNGTHSTWRAADGPAALAGPWAARENPVFIRPTAPGCSSHPPERAPPAESAYRPTPANRTLRHVAYKQLRPPPGPPSPPPSLFRAAHIRVAVAARSPLRGFLKVSYTQQVYFYSNSYGIVG